MTRDEGRDREKDPQREQEKASLFLQASMMLLSHSPLCLPAFGPETPAFPTPISPQLPTPSTLLHNFAPSLFSSCWPRLSDRRDVSCLSPSSSPVLGGLQTPALYSCQLPASRSPMSLINMGLQASGLSYRSFSFLCAAQG